MDVMRHSAPAPSSYKLCTAGVKVRFDGCIASGMGDGTVTELPKYLYECTVSYTEIRSDERTLFSGSFMDMRARKTRQPSDARNCGVCRRHEICVWRA